MGKIPDNQSGKIKSFYYQDKLNMREIATIFGVSIDAVVYFMRRHNIKRRSFFAINKLRFDRKIPSFKVKPINSVRKKELKAIGSMLYWGEGYKYENGELGFTNSSPNIIRFYFKWLKLWNVDKNSLIFRLTLNEFFGKEEKKILSFWIDFLDVKKEQFSKTTFIQTNLKKASIKNVEKYRGILRVKVRKGTALRNKILGAIEHISNT